MNHRYVSWQYGSIQEIVALQNQAYNNGITFSEFVITTVIISLFQSKYVIYDTIFVDCSPIECDQYQLRFLL